MNIKNLMYSSCGLYSLLPTLASYTGQLALKKSAEETKNESPLYLKEHINKQCHALGLQNIPCYTIANSPSEARICNSPGLKPYIIVNSNSFRKFSPTTFRRLTNIHTYDKNMLIGVVNHELGHAFHQHSSQETYQNLALGVFCFLTKTRFFSMSAIIFNKIFSAPLSRFKEKQADDICAKISTPGELKGVIRMLENHSKLNPIKSPNFFSDTHPATKERIAFFEKALKEKL
jgi:hypothetical protein